MSGQGMAYNTLVSVSERMFPGITVGLGHNYNTMEYAAVKLGNQVVSSLALVAPRARFCVLECGDHFGFIIQRYTLEFVIIAAD